MGPRVAIRSHPMPEIAHMSKLQGKVAVVTGASKGIGAAIAKGLAKEGAAVVVNYASSRADADAVVSAIVEAGGRASPSGRRIQGSRGPRLVEAAVKEFGRLDVLVNNSGSTNSRRSRRSPRSITAAVRHQRPRRPPDDAAAAKHSAKAPAS
ncbi:hypothetical protein Lal_00046447 [Lupinus albus]|nr:hypothetical protein Lal_00046447 [Lupinus albus]